MPKVYILEDDIEEMELKFFLKDSVMISKIAWGETEQLREHIRKGVLIISEAKKNLLQSGNLLVYEEMVRNFCEYSTQLYHKDFDYFYMKNSLKKAVEDKVETIVVGNSYPRLGIEPQILDKCANLGLFSQDIFYSDKIVRNICHGNNKVKYVIWGCGYYTMYSDLSRSQNRMELLKISNVYYPLFNDSHNCMLFPARSYCLDQSEIYDVKKIVEHMTEKLYQQNGFNYWVKGIRTRKQCQYNKAYDDPSKSWEELTEQEKASAGQRRAAMHNRSLKRKHSLEENVDILNELCLFLNKRNIKFIVVVFPASKYYAKYLDLQYKEDFYNVLEALKSEIHVVDCFDVGIFEEEDFIDTDHLNERGAIKMSNILKGILKELEF